MCSESTSEYIRELTAVATTTAAVYFEPTTDEPSMANDTPAVKGLPLPSVARSREGRWVHRRARRVVSMSYRTVHRAADIHGSSNTIITARSL